MNRLVRSSLLFLLVLGFSGAINAQVSCQPAETMITCWTRVMKANKQRVAEAVKEQGAALAVDEKKDLEDKPTGVETGGANLESNTSDFLPLLALSGLLGDVKDGDVEGTYVVDFNFLIPWRVQEHNSKLQAVVNSQPQLSDGIKEQLPEDQRDEFATKLEAGLGDLSDYTLSYSFNWMDSKHGRGMDQYRNRIAALAFAVAKKFELPDSENDALRRLGDIASQFAVEEEEDAKEEEEEVEEAEDLGEDEDDAEEEVEGDEGVEKEQDPLKIPFKDMGDQRPMMQQAVERAIAQELDLFERHRETWRDAGMGYLGDLLDNQPQLTFSAQRRFRDPVAGGDEDWIKVAYGWGSANFNKALKDGNCAKELDTTQPDGVPTLDKCLDFFTNYVNENTDEIKNGHKFSFFAEYMNVDEKVFDLPEQDLTGLKINAAKKLIIKGGWSRLFPAGEGGETPVRFDLVGSYEDVSDDPQRQDRGVATLTVTRQFGDLAIPFGIVYANHGEFLGEVDEQFSAHLGLKFDLETGGNED